MTVSTTDFVTAVRSVEAEKKCTFRIDRVLAQNLIEEVNRRRTGNETGEAFHTLFQQAVEYYHVKEGEQRWYRRVIGRYFNPRAVRAKQANTRGSGRAKQGLGAPAVHDPRPFPRVIGHATAHCATVEVFEEGSITFSTTKLIDKLAWEEVLYGAFHPAISPDELHEAHKLALSVMNSRR